MLLTSIPIWVNHQLESRVREIRSHGSEGGGAIRSPYPYNLATSYDRRGRLHHKVVLRASGLLSGASGPGYN